MENSGLLISLCKRVIADNRAGLLDLHAAAEKINKQANDYPIEDMAHPMLRKIADLSFDIADDYRSDADDDADWAMITKIVDKYIASDWEPTCWILSMMYGEYTNDKLAHSYSVIVRRQNGDTLIGTASKILKNRVGKVAERLNSEQTDERYLQNLTKVVPEHIGEYRLVSTTLAEYLAETPTTPRLN